MTDSATKPATMSEVYLCLSEDKTNGYSLAEFRKDWAGMSDKDKVDLKNGIGNGTFNY